MRQISLMLIAAMVMASCNNSAGWTTEQKEKSRKTCIDEVAGKFDDSIVKKYCDCFVEKMIQKYPSYAEADKKGTQEEGMKMGEACIAELKLNNQGNNDNSETGGGSGGDQGNGGADNGWTQAQFQQFVQGCASTAQKMQGMTAEQASAYCECMTRKVAQKYSFEVAARMTAADFQSQEWINAADECRARVMGQPNNNQ